MFEFFYSFLDRDFFQENEFIACLKLLRLDHVQRLTRTEWSIVRGIMGFQIGRPRRFSPIFLRGERQKLYSYRNGTRRFLSDSIISNRVPNQYNFVALTIGDSIVAYDYRNKLFQHGIVKQINVSMVEGCLENPGYMINIYNEKDKKVVAYTDLYICLAHKSKENNMFSNQYSGSLSSVGNESVSGEVRYEHAATSSSCDRAQPDMPYSCPGPVSELSTPTSSQPSSLSSAETDGLPGEINSQPDFLPTAASTSLVEEHWLLAAEESISLVDACFAQRQRESSQACLRPEEGPSLQGYSLIVKLMKALIAIRDICGRREIAQDDRLLKENENQNGTRDPHGFDLVDTLFAVASKLNNNDDAISTTSKSIQMNFDFSSDDSVPINPSSIVDNLINIINQF